MESGAAIAGIAHTGLGVEGRASLVRVISSLVIALAMFGAVALIGVGPAHAAPLTYASAPINGTGTNGTGRAVVALGSTVYVGGSFSAAGSTARANVAAFDAASGALRTGFVANTNGEVRAMASDGTSLFIAGSFTSVNGVARARLAAVDLATGAVRTGFRADTSSTVYALEVYGGQVYLTGAFTSVAGTARNRVAAVSASTGAVDPGFNPNANNATKAVAVSPDGSRVYLGGLFTNIGGGARSFIAAVSRTTGALTGPTFHNPSYEVLDLDVAPDGARVFGAVGGYGNRAVSWSASSGARQWYYQVDGDTQAIRYAAGNVYFGFHEGAFNDYSVRMLAADAATGALVAFRPTVDSFYGVWDIDATATDLAIAGEFRTVAGVSRRGISNFRASTSPPPSGQTFVAQGSAWRYLDNGSDQGTAWRATTFNDSAWTSGPAQLGYGDGDERTVVSYGPNASNRYVTTYFRASFSVANPAAVGSLRLQLLRDDGAVVYVNGTEVVRSNMPGGTIGYRTFASSVIAGGAESAFTSYALSPSVLRTGTNVIAVEVHQSDVASSDISFDLALTT